MQILLVKKHFALINYLVHQKGLINKSVYIEIPKNFEIGSAKLFIFAGDSDKAQEEEAPLNYNYKNLTEFLKYYKSRYKNNELVVKIEQKLIEMEKEKTEEKKRQEESNAADDIKNKK